MTDGQNDARDVYTLKEENAIFKSLNTDLEAKITALHPCNLCERDCEGEICFNVREYERITKAFDVSRIYNAVQENETLRVDLATALTNEHDARNTITGLVKKNIVLENNLTVLTKKISKAREIWDIIKDGMPELKVFKTMDKSLQE
jgi:hypothetical protein